MSKLIKFSSFLLLLMIILSFNIFISADEAIAQESEVSSLAIEEIIVTARKKDESIQHLVGKY